MCVCVLMVKKNKKVKKKLRVHKKLKETKKNNGLIDINSFFQADSILKPNFKKSRKLHYFKRNFFSYLLIRWL